MATLLNLLLPGCGLILVGNAASGTLIGLLFAASANCAVVSWMLLPDDFSPTWRGLALGVALGTYIGAQMRMAQTLRTATETAADAARRAQLRTVRQALIDERYADALKAIEPLRELADSDLLVAVRLAQTLAASGDVHASRRAWEQVRVLDRHRVYRDLVREHLG